MAPSRHIRTDSARWPDPSAALEWPYRPTGATKILLTEVPKRSPARRVNDAERCQWPPAGWRGLSLRLPNRTGPAQNGHAGGGRNRCARTSLTSPARKPAGFCCPGGLCAAARQFIKYGCSQSFARYFSPRLLFGVGAMKSASKVVFAIALILGLVSTVAANVSLVTAPQVSTRN